MKPTKAGDLVTFSHWIRSADSGVLSLEIGIVTGFSEDRRIAHLVWNDGVPGTYRVKDLARKAGTIGAVAQSARILETDDGHRSYQPMRTKPLRDRGHKPVPTPKRTIPPPLPRRKTEWLATETKRLESIVLDKPHTDGAGKQHDTTFVKFQVPLVDLTVRASHWSPDHTWAVKHDRHGWRVVYSDGSVQRIRPQAADAWLDRTFGAFSSTLRAMVS